MSCLEHGSDKGHITRLVVVDPVAYDKLTHETMSGSRHEGEKFYTNECKWAYWRCEINTDFMLQIAD